MGGLSDEVLVARAYLSRVGEPANMPIWELVRREGPVEAARALQAGTAPEAAQAAVASRKDQFDPFADLDAAHRRGIRLVAPESSEWPHFGLSCLEAAGGRRLTEYRAGKRSHAEHGEPIPPLALWVRGNGDLATVGVRSAGIVGSRAATGYGERLALDFAADLAARDFVVISGGAYGVDAAAHRGALVSGTTMLISAGGLDRAYPPSNAALYERVAEAGLLVSESPPGAAPQRRKFLTRNRLIAALSTGTVVIEAAKRSGATNTAGHCVRLGRPLMAVPGPVTSAMSAGCHELLAREHDPAVLVTSASEVIAVIGSASDLPLPSRVADGTQPTGGEGRPPDNDIRAELDQLDETSRRVLDGFAPRRAMGLDELAVTAGVSAIDVLRASGAGNRRLGGGA